MRVLRTVLICLLFVAAVFISSANVHLVELVYLPGIGIESTWEPRSIRAPLFVVVLGALLIGALLGGAAAIFEQTRLRLALRQSRKAAEKAASDVEAVRDERARDLSEAARLRQELADARRALSPPNAQIESIDDA